MKSANQERGLKEKSNTYLNTQVIGGINQTTNDSKSLKIWSVTTKSMQEYANRFVILQKNMVNKTFPEDYLFEIIGIF